jgi:hypothetical protein
MTAMKRGCLVKGRRKTKWAACKGGPLLLWCNLRYPGSQENNDAVS